MDNDFKLIDEFLSNFTPEVEGRSATLSPDLREKLEGLRNGSLDPETRREVSRELLSNPSAMDFLVSAVRGNETA